MIELARTIRFCINLGAAGDDHPAPARHNSFAGWPSMAGIGAFYELQVRCRGLPDPQTGYLMNISAIDDAVRRHAIPIVQAAVHHDPNQPPWIALARIVPALRAALGDAFAGVRWRLSPYYSIAMAVASPHRVSISQQFEFAASHRLHLDALSEDENRRIFGKCHNPNGHGHNYRLEVSMSAPLDAVASAGAAVAGGAATQASGSQSQPAFTLAHLERIVDQTVIQRFDHKHLNLDTVEFASLNPSVENIAKVCHDLLAAPLARAGGQLERVTVWETQKTSCSYPAPRE